MSTTRLQANADRRTARLRADLVEQLRRLREDAGVPVRELGVAAGLTPAYVAKILAGTERPTLEAYGRLAAVLGADLATRLYPNTGPAIHDRLSAPILEFLLGVHDPRWSPYSEIGVRSPSRGWIDVGFHEPRENVFLATEIQSALHRLEQFIRWSAAKAASLASWDGWDRVSGQPAISQLLVVRRTRATRQVAMEFKRQLRAAYPAHPDDAVAALTGTAAWPGSAMVWVALEGGRVRWVSGR